MVLTKEGEEIGSEVLKLEEVTPVVGFESTSVDINVGGGVMLAGVGRRAGENDDNSVIASAASLLFGESGPLVGCVNFFVAETLKKAREEAASADFPLPGVLSCSCSCQKVRNNKGVVLL